MTQGSMKKIVDSVWLKVIGILAAGLFTLVSSYGVYHLNKLDDTVKKIQQDKLELIDRINAIDSRNQGHITEVKETVNEINVALREFIARTDASRFTSEDGLEVWREIARIKQSIVDMQRQIERNSEENGR